MFRENGPWFWGFNPWLKSNKSYIMWGREAVTREAHNLENAGSIPAPATIVKQSRMFDNSFKRTLLNVFAR